VKLLAAFLALVATGGPGAESAPATGAISWRTDEAGARAESERTGRPLLVDAWADWCAACKLLERNTWSDPQVQREIRVHFVPLRVDLSEEGPVTEARMKMFGLVALPAVLVCSPRACDGSALRSVGYVNAAAMLDFLRRSQANR
jgi:thiol:disulfide interchange protein DsbD